MLLEIILYMSFQYYYHTVLNVLQEHKTNSLKMLLRIVSEKLNVTQGKTRQAAQTHLILHVLHATDQLLSIYSY
jgi:hypothetical protein